MKIRLWNETKQSWVKDADSDDCGPVEFDFMADALKCLERVNQLKLCNPANVNDQIETREYSTYP